MSVQALTQHRSGATPAVACLLQWTPPWNWTQVKKKMIKHFVSRKSFVGNFIHHLSTNSEVSSDSLQGKNIEESVAALSTSYILLTGALE